MASAILPSRNQPSWSGYGSKFTNGDLYFNRLENVTTSNPNPNSTANRNPSHCFFSDTRRDARWKNHEQLLSSAPREAAFTGSTTSSVPANSFCRRYITFRLGSYTRREIKDLKKRLMSDLERVRSLRHLICSAPVNKANYRPPPPAPEVVLTVGQKRTKPLPSVRETKKQCGSVKCNTQRSKLAMRKCGQILVKLMNHKHGWVFNTPVNATAMKLYDYHSIIKNPMDLGTVKSKLGKNEYDSPHAFASDVRLTFQNAILYNGEGSDVFNMAERLLSLFEDLFNPTQHKLISNQVKKQNGLNPKPVPNPAVVVSAANLGNLMTTTDSKKPEMTAEEKSELAESLLNLQLGQEGMDKIMTIIKKRVSDLEHEGDEIELDLAVLDNETLWELHSFINGSRKLEGMVSNLVSSLQAEKSPVEEDGRRRDGGEEDIVDIGEEIPVTNFPPVEIEKDASSSESDSSSSDSGSEDEASKEGNV